MNDFSDSYVGQLRAKVGHDPLLIPGTRLFLENEDGQMLMQLRRDFRIWGFPGGNAELGETLDDCIAREVREEVGLEIADAIPVAFSCDPRHETLTYPNGDVCQFYVLMYWTRTFTGTPSIKDDESLELGWFGPDDWPPMLPTMKRGLEAFQKYRQTGAFQVL